MRALHLAPLLIALTGCDLTASYSHLAVVVVETDSPPNGTLSVGRGLSVDLAARIHAYDGVTKFHDHEPSGLSVSAQDPSFVRVAITPGALELDGSDHLVDDPIAPNATKVSLTPLVVDGQEVLLDSVDADAPVMVSLAGFDVDGVAWNLAANGEQRHETELPVFVSSTVIATPVYSSGGHIVFGTAPLSLSATADDGTALDGNTITLGPVPQSAVVTTTVGPGRLTLDTVDASAIADLELDVSLGDPSAMAAGSQLFVAVKPLDAQGVAIAGQAPVAPAVSIQGSAVHLGSQVGQTFVIDADAAGDATATFSWANATRTLALHVQ